MLETIKNKTKNIGSLILFLKNDKNREYLDFININTPEFLKSEDLVLKIYYLVNDIQKPMLCKCGKKLKFIGFKNGFRKTCGEKECFVESRKVTNIEKYGVDNPKKSIEILKKEQENIKAKWNGYHYMKSKDIKSKFNQTMLNRHGVEWAQQNSKIKSKSIETWNQNDDKDNIIKKRTEIILNKTIEEKNIIELKKRNKLIEKYGSYDNFIEYRKNKIKEKSITKFGVEHHFSSPQIIKKRIESYTNNITNKIIQNLSKNLIYLNRESNQNGTDFKINLYCDKCKNNFEITRQYFYLRVSQNEEICLKCNPILNGTSKMEIELFEFIKSKYQNQILQNHKLFNQEIDIYLPLLNIGFEFNGLYWHSDIYKDSNFHLNKTKLLSNNGVKLVHIWEDDWTYRKEIVKSMILNKIGETKNKIFARKTEIKEVNDNILIRDFLNENHIQGFVGSKIKIGLFYNNELVSLITFGNLRKSLGQKSQEGSYELLRFCNKLNTSVVGGASKLFKYFINNYEPKEIISYSDYSRSTGNMYEQLGFSLSHNSDPNYYWVIGGIRRHRFNFRKDKLIKEGFDPSLTEVEIMKNRGLYRIFDCGMQKWTYQIITTIHQEDISESNL
jgi:hypothetical protein